MEHPEYDGDLAKKELMANQPRKECNIEIFTRADKFSVAEIFSRSGCWLFLLKINLRYLIELNQKLVLLKRC